MARPLFAVPILAAAIFATTCLAQPVSPVAPVAIPRTEETIHLDGHLDEPAWKSAATIELAYETFPGENTPAFVQTVCLLTFNERGLYLAFRAEDPSPPSIRAHLSDRDNAFRDDIVGIVVDSFLDGRRGFAFMANPLGVQMDAVVEGVGGAAGYGSVTGSPSDDYSWDAIWDSAGRLTPTGFVVEMGIPWTALRFPRGAKVQTWGLVVFRSYPRSVRRRLLSVPVDRNETCFLCQAGRITGLSGMKPGRGLEFTPTGTYSRTDTRDDFPAGPLAKSSEEAESGLSARWGITPNISLNAAINPDFSQVEADAAQLEINRRFTLFFPEKRPFFLEGADLFRTPFRVVHTRTVADPSWGLKLTAKEGPHAVGAFLAHDRVTNLILPGNQGSRELSLAEGNDTYVLRYRRDLGKSSFLGAMVTDREAGEYSSRLGGIDGQISLSPTDLINFQYLRSSTRYGEEIAATDLDFDGTSDYDLPAERFDDDALLINFDHDGRNWGWWFWHGDKGPEFRADTGFITRVDTRSFGTGGRRTFWGDEGSRLNRAEIIFNASRTRDHDDQLTDESLNLRARLEGPYQSLLIGGINRDRSLFSDVLYDLDRAFIFFNIRPSGEFTSSLAVNWGDAIDFANSRPARRVQIRPGVTWNIGRHLFLRMDHTFERLRVEGARLFRANLTEGRLVYQFGVRTFLRAIIQRTAIDRNPTLYTFDVDARSRRVFSQYLFSYKLNPQTVFFAGYSDTRRGDDETGLLRANRTIFVKLGYAWIL